MDNWNIRIHMLPAKSGDGFVIEFNNNECIIIDTGFKDTYYKYLKPLLVNLKKQGKKVTLLVITHIDKDHIGGAKKLIEENGDYNTPNIIKIENIWFNGFKNLVFKKDLSKVLSDKQLNKMKNIRARNKMANLDEIDNRISAYDLKAFESICNEFHYPINKQFKNGIVEKIENIKVGNACIDILSPNTFKINKYTEYLEKQLLKLFGDGYQIDKSEEFITFFETLVLNEEYDNSTIEKVSSLKEKDITDWLKIANKNKLYSIVNDISIVLLIKFNNKKLLFTGDFYFDDTSLKKEKFNVDVLKVAHHGSYWNNCKIMNNVVADNYLISTDGKKYNHPSKNILGNIIISNKSKKNLIFNYKIKDLSLLENEEQKNKYNFEYIVSNEILI